MINFGRECVVCLAWIIQKIKKAKKALAEIERNTGKLPDKMSLDSG